MNATCRLSPRPVWLRLLRPDSDARDDIGLDVLWLLVVGLALIAIGIGLRDPWPADEPRFALVARDMAALGDWLVPRVGGDIYADKPPLYFWFMALCIELFDSLRAAFLIPSLLSALATVLLVYDLGRRLWNRETGLIAGLALLFTVQFVWQARQAQIDAMLCFWTTLGLYGLLRHLLLGPQWRWYYLGWAAAGFGVITKGVGFLPLLILIPYAIWGRDSGKPCLPRAAVRWLLGPVAFAAALCVWLVPMLLAAHADPQIAAYRDEILFHQTIGRYANAWHHQEPFWYFLVAVIPWLWLPWTALSPWLAPRWRDAWRERDLRIVLPLTWIALVVLFFSLSSGKRGVYVLPALPALALICAPYVRELAVRLAAQRAVFVVAALTAAVTVFAVAYLLIRPDERLEVIAAYGLDPLAPLAVLAIASVAVCARCGPQRGFAAFAGVCVVILSIVSFWINPAMNDVRSGKDFMRRIDAAADPSAPLALAGFKEQYLLQARRPIVHFGHARWREGSQEVWDAAHWLAQSPHRQLVVEGVWLRWCFEDAQRQSLGIANRREWFLVRGAVNPQCDELGSSRFVQRYVPPLQSVRTPSRKPITSH